MRNVRNLVLSLLFIFFLMIIYYNFDSVSLYFKNLITKDNEVKLSEPNEYKRNYNYKKFTNDEDYIPHTINDIENIFYNILNNGWSEFIFYCPSEYKKCTNDVEKVSSDSTIMSKISGYVSPYNAHKTINTAISSYGEVYVNISKKYSKEEINEINNKIKEIHNNLNLKDKDVEEKIKLFHDYLIKNTTYDEVFANSRKSVYNSSKANGALIDHYAVCGGYSDALAIFLDYINVPNIIISNENHAWNLVSYNNYYLHIDPTWNDTEIERFDYDFYMINTTKLLKLDPTEHKFDRDFFIEAN